MLPASPLPLARRLCCVTFAAAALLGGLAGLGCLGCLTTLGPNIRREEHHVRMTQQATRGGCMTCHESEAQMTRKMQGMSPAEMDEHMRRLTTVIRPPLVQDWMLREPRECVVCHTVREPRR